MLSRIQEVFELVVGMDDGERDAALAEACGRDVALRKEVDMLLGAHVRAAGFLATPTAGEQPSGVKPGSGALSEMAGSVIGRYKLLQLIGEGGFGSVFMAEQREPVQRRVALKIIKMGMDTRQVIARFEAERQAIAMMDHPNIAKVLDAGATDSGRPYFVMELVRGDPVTTYCDRHNLSTRDRLELFVDVCRAVQHAHQKGIIHRDIKPGNVLVTVADGKPIPKVIDFGIAKATSSRLTEKTLFTEHRALIGTLEYMSPEQADLSGVDVDTRTDVYALGVLLYELLTGVTPFDPKQLRSKGYAECQRIIREVEPPKPSTRLSSMKASLSELAAHRHTEPARLPTLVRGDLDWIVMKCLEKDRTRRYETASALAADVTRHLAGEPVTAAPPSAGYRARKFVRRHRGFVMAASAVVVALVTGSAFAVAGYVSAVDARDEAVDARIAEGNERQRAEDALAAARTSEGAALEKTRVAKEEAGKAKAINGFLNKLLRGAGPQEAKGNRNITMRELVDRSAREIDAGELNNQPEVRATVLGTIGQLYRDLGDNIEAERRLRKAIEIGEGGALTAVEVAMLRNDVGHIQRDAGKLEEAERSYMQALEEAQRFGAENNRTVGGIYNSLAGIAMERKQYPEARALYTHALEKLEAAGMQDDRSYFILQLNLGTLARSLGDKVEAERRTRDVLERAGKVLGPDDPVLVEAGRNLGVVTAELGRFADGEGILLEALAVSRRVHGDTHPKTISIMTQLGGLALVSGNYAAAERLYGEVLGIVRGLPENGRGDPSDAMRGMATAVETLGRAAEVEGIRREMLETARGGGGGGAGSRKQELSLCLGSLGHNLLLQRRWTEAEPVLRECLALRRELYPPEHAQVWSTTTAQSMLGEVVLGRAEMEKNAEEADALFVEAESLIVPAAESLPSDQRVPKPAPGGFDRQRQAIDRAARLYASWQRVAPDAARAEKMKVWEGRLAEFDAGKTSGERR